MSLVVVHGPAAASGDIVIGFDWAEAVRDERKRAIGICVQFQPITPYDRAVGFYKGISKIDHGALGGIHTHSGCAQWFFRAIDVSLLSFVAAATSSTEGER